MFLKNNTPEYIGLIPAAGQAQRISPLPCSKEIFPIGFGNIRQKDQLHPKVAAHYLLEKMCFAGAQRAYLVLRKGKWDIPAYFGNGSIANISLGYLMTDFSYGVPFTLDSAFPFLKNKYVLFGFPDILFQPDDAYARLIERMDASRATIVLGLFLAENSQKMDMVELNADGTIRGIQIKPIQTNLEWTWIISVWNYAFTKFMHEYVQNYLHDTFNCDNDPINEHHKEIYLGEVFQAAIEFGLQIEQVIFSKGNYVDIGTTEDLVRAMEKQICP